MGYRYTIRIKEAKIEDFGYCETFRELMNVIKGYDQWKSIEMTYTEEKNKTAGKLQKDK